jgi:hypothetical protein
MDWQDHITVDPNICQSTRSGGRSPMPKLPYLLNFGDEKITLQSGLLKEDH